MAPARRWQAAPLMGRLDPADRGELLRMGIRRWVAADEPIIREGQCESHVVVLHRALAKVTAIMADGRQALLSIRVSGDLVGETLSRTGVDGDIETWEEHQRCQHRRSTPMSCVSVRPRWLS